MEVLPLRFWVCLFADVDAQGFHLPIAVGAFEAEGFGGSGDVAFGLFEFADTESSMAGREAR